MQGSRYWLAGAMLILAMAGISLAVGRSFFCDCGTIRLWVGDIDSAENSQQIADWYSLTHVVHGFLLFAIAWIAFRSRPVGFRAVLAIALEAGWELLENSPWVIERYQTVTIATSYAGDAVVNSLADIGFMLLGFWLAWRLPVWASLLVVAGLELSAVAIMRDSLSLNLLMLIWPVDMVRDWQAAGA